MEEKYKKKINKISGLEYVNEAGKTVPGRKLKEMDCSKCKSKCSQKVTQEDRQLIFRTYWNLSTLSAKMFKTKLQLEYLQTGEENQMHFIFQ